MKWMIYKDNSKDLGFALSCLFSQAITMDEFKQWLEIVLMDTPTDELPNYFFDLIDFNQAKFHLDTVIGFSPSNDLSRYEKYAVEGIAYIMWGSDSFVIENSTPKKAQNDRKHKHVA